MRSVTCHHIRIGYLYQPYADRIRGVPLFQWHCNKEDDHIYGSARDITEKVALHTELVQTRDMLVRTNRTARVGGWKFNLETKQLWWSDVTREIHEVAPNYTPNLEDGISFYKEGYSRTTIHAAVEKALAHGTPWDVELQIVTAKGKELWVRAVGEW